MIAGELAFADDPLVLKWKTLLLTCLKEVRPQRMSIRPVPGPRGQRGVPPLTIPLDDSLVTRF